jgi:hypothetical protein
MNQSVTKCVRASLLAVGLLVGAAGTTVAQDDNRGNRDGGTTVNTTRDNRADRGFDWGWLGLLGLLGLIPLFTGRRDDRRDHRATAGRVTAP